MQEKILAAISAALQMYIAEEEADTPPAPITEQIDQTHRWKTSGRKSQMTMRSCIESRSCCKLEQY